MVGVGLPLAFHFYQLAVERDKFMIILNPERASELQHRANHHKLDLIRFLVLGWLAAFLLLWQFAHTLYL
jgi:hypothetical protein